MLQKILRELLSHTLRERCDKSPLVPLRPQPNLVKQIINLIMTRTHIDNRVKQPRRANNLFHHNTLSLPKLILRRRRRNINNLMNHLTELIKPQRTIVKSRRQTETILHQVRLPSTVTTIHRTKLRNTHMTLINHQKKIIREKVKQRVRPLTGQPAVKIPRIILNPGTVPQLLNHLNVIFHTLLDTLSPHTITHLREKINPLTQILTNTPDSNLLLLLRRHKQIRRIHLIPIKRNSMHRHILRINLLNTLNLIIPERHTNEIHTIGNKHINRVTLHTKLTPRRTHVITHIKRINQHPQQPIPAQPLTNTDINHRTTQRSRTPHAINTRHRRDNHNIPPARKQSRQCRQPQTVNLIINRKILLNIRVRMRQISLRLIIVIVRNIILNRILRKKLLHLSIKLGSQRLVMTQNQRRTIHIRNHISNSESLTRTRNTQQHLSTTAPNNTLRQLTNSLRLITRRTIFRRKPESIHNTCELI